MINLNSSVMHEAEDEFGEGEAPMKTWARRQVLPRLRGVPSFINHDIDVKAPKRVVFVSVRVIQIGNISERDQTFEARIDVFVDWHDTMPEHQEMSAVELDRFASGCVADKTGAWWEPVIR